MSSGSAPQAQERYLVSPNSNVDIIQAVGPGGNILLALTSNGGVQVVPQPITANGAINPFIGGTYIITKTGSAALLTLAAPIAGVDDGNIIEILSATAFAHSITATGLLQTGTSNVNSVTFPAQAGASVTLTAFQGKWILQTPGNGTYTLG